MNEYKKELREFLAKNPNWIQEVIEQSERGYVTVLDLTLEVCSKLSDFYSRTEFNDAVWLGLEHRGIQSVDELVDKGYNEKLWDELVPEYRQKTLCGFMSWIVNRMTNHRETYTEYVLQNHLNELCLVGKLQEAVPRSEPDNGFMDYEYRLAEAKHVIDVHQDREHISFLIEFKDLPTVAKVEEVLQLGDDDSCDFDYKHVCAMIKTDIKYDQWEKKVSSCHFRFENAAEVLEFLTHLNRQPLKFTVKPYTVECEEWDRILIQLRDSLGKPFPLNEKHVWGLYPPEHSDCHEIDQQAWDIEMGGEPIQEADLNFNPGLDSGDIQKTVALVLARCPVAVADMSDGKTLTFIKRRGADRKWIYELDKVLGAMPDVAKKLDSIHYRP